MKATNFELIKILHQFPAKKEGAKYHKALCIVDWYGKGPKYDIRDWNSDHTEARKGVCLTEEELRELAEVLEEILK